MSDKELDLTELDETLDDFIEFEDAVDETVSSETAEHEEEFEFDTQDSNDVLEDISDEDVEIEDFNDASDDKKESQKKAQDSEPKAQNPLIRYAIFGVGATVLAAAGYVAYSQFLAPSNSGGLTPTAQTAQNTYIPGQTSNPAVPGVPGLAVPATKTVQSTVNTQPNKLETAQNVKPNASDVLASLNGSSAVIEKPVAQVAQAPIGMTDKAVVPQKKQTEAFVKNEMQDAQVQTQSPQKENNGLEIKKIEELKKSLKSIEDKLDNQNKILASKLAQNSNDSNKVKELEAKVSELKSKLTIISDEHSVMTSRLIKEQDYIHRLESATESAYKKIKSYKNKVKALQKKIRFQSKTKSKMKKVTIPETKWLDLKDLSVMGANSSKVVFKSKSGRVLTKSVGDSILGHVIKSIDIYKGIVVTTGGNVRIP